jgi:hypothetical protein
MLTTHAQPPLDCSIDFERDCPNGQCLITGISTNVKTLAECVAGKSPTGKTPAGKAITCKDALSWVTHFVGEVTHPLHVSSYHWGGTDDNVEFDGTQSSLHFFYDEIFPYVAVGAQAPKEFHPPRPWGPNKTANGSFPITTLDPHMKKLVAQLKREGGSRSRRIQDWTRCTNPKKAKDCALEWARDADKQNCGGVYPLPSGPKKSSRKPGDKEEYVVLDAEYGERAAELVKEQLSKAIVRLAALMDQIVQ